MSRFEFVSVAVALLYSIGVGRLLSSMPDVFDRERRYWVHAAWVIYLLLFSALAWWNLFDLAHDFEFGPVGFLGALCAPAFVIVRAQILLGRASREIHSYREHFFENRVAFFSIGLASMILILLGPWSSGAVPFWEISPFQLRTFPFVLVWIAGLSTSNPRVHAGLVCGMLLVAGGQFLVNANTSFVE